MPPTRASRLFAICLAPRPQQQQQQQLISAGAVASRCYATTKPTTSKKANPRATAAQLNAVRKRAATRKTDPQDDGDSLAARTPLKKPSTGGLGVPSASPSPASASTPTQAPPGATKSTSSNNEMKGTAETPATTEAEEKEELLRTARMQRSERTREEERRRGQDRAYGERESLLKWRYMRVVVGLPFVLVLSWELWARLAKGREQKKPAMEDSLLTMERKD